MRPSEIRTEADELTYDLHVLLRFELEVGLFEGDLTVADLPEAWNAKMEEYLGIVPENDALGVLQDTHWAIGYFGYFPSYTLGNVLSVQLFEAATKGAARDRARDGARRVRRSARVAAGERPPPRQKVRTGRPDPHATGRPPDTAPYLRYLESKFGELYGLKLL